MDTNSTEFISLRLSCRAAKNIVIIGVVCCLAVAALTAAMIVSGERSHKGDRLQPVPQRFSTVPSPVVTTLSRPPIGCEPAFSSVADPWRSHVFGRCVS